MTSHKDWPVGGSPRLEVSKSMSTKKCPFCAIPRIFQEQFEV